MSKVIGLIAEDVSDIDVLRALIRKVTGKTALKTHHFVGHGCGKILGKCNQWAYNLKRRGCTFLIVVQDLDNKTLVGLATDLESALQPCPISKNIVVIPVQMIEAWLLSDAQAIRKALNLPDTVNQIPNPEALLDPKSRLGEIIRIRSRGEKRYVNTIHNAKIANEIRVHRLRRCRSFKPFESFVKNTY
jgi:hypothetical protein